MPFEKYIDKNFQQKTLDIIRQANKIIDEYAEEGFSLTLRQLYYQFVARGLLENKSEEYNKLGIIVNDARLAGLIDWDAIEDRTRNLQVNSHWDNPGSIIRSARYSFQTDHWQGQGYQPEVWIEKEALAGIISGICEELDVPYFACRGYVSQSEMWRAGRRFTEYINCEREPVLIHLGDHDPSGIDMTRDIEDRLTMFTLHGRFSVERIALNFDQIEKYNPPPNPAKVTDSRFRAYLLKFGLESWELDALDPLTLRDLIEATVETFRDDELYQKVLDQEKEYIEVLEKLEKNWENAI